MLLHLNGRLKHGRVPSKKTGFTRSGFKHLNKTLSQVQTLIEACKRGDVKSQSALFDLFKRKWMGICVRYIKDHDEAKDVFQDASFRIFSDLKKLRQIETFESWSRKIMINHALNTLKKKEAYFMVLREYTDSRAGETETDTHLLERMDGAEVLALINQMPDGYRVVLNLALVDGYKHAEIATALSISESTSRSQLNKARKFLQRLIENLKQKENARIAG
jgi:RNA polymerase sigma factor (sigma-70 family)